jgi:putative colanic acid biosynthesis UDP-glucose lipid carrier transferase
MAVIDALHDTTASIYFVPDVFVFDLIQSRVQTICGLPAISLCETPFFGFQGLIKRVMDFLLAGLALLVLSPFLLLVAVLVRATSPGSVLFRQRRYGLDGREIVVYKFRTMRVSEDGNAVIQAKRADPRLTPIGGFLRKYSIDELPQLINVLQGSMSLVGPRPHAVAHNEEYRKLIKGYMFRHKVLPGITGWAQVNGYRGGTECLEDMQARVEYDLDYLRHWSLWLDFKILFLTVLTVHKHEKAY